MTLTRITSDGITDGTITGTDLTTNVDFVDNQKLRLGTGNDLQIYHNGSNSFIDESSGTGRLIIRTGGMDIKTEASAETIATFNMNGAVELYHDNSKKFQTTSSGIELLDGLFLNNATNAGKDINWDQANNHFEFFDNVAATFGTGNDLQIYHDGSNSYLDNHTGVLFLRGDGDNITLQAVDGENALIAKPNGTVELYYDASKKFETTSTGITTTGQVKADVNTSLNSDTEYNGQDFGFLVGYDGGFDANSEGNGICFAQQYANSDASIVRTGAIIGYKQQANGNFGGGLKLKTQKSGANAMGTALQLDQNQHVLIPNDNAELRIGASADLKLYHDGSNSFITNTSSGGYLHIRSGSGINLQDDTGDENFIKCIDNGAVELYYDSVKKFETTSYGAYVSCTDQSDGLLVSAAVEGTVTVEDRRNAAYKARFYMAGSGPVIRTLNTNASDNTMLFVKGSTNIAQWTGEGHYLPGSNNTYDLGSTSKRFRNIYTNDLNLSNEGGSNDVDGTWGSYTIQEGAEDLFLVNKRSGKKYKFNLTEVS